MITRDQIGAARGLLGWSYDKLAEEAELSRVAVINIANGKTEPHRESITKIRTAFERYGVELIEGGARRAQDILTVYEGSDCYLKFLDDAYRALSVNKGEILFSGADERRSPPEVIERLRTMRRSGITMRSLIKNGDTYIMGKPEEYRWLDESLFVDSDVKIIYRDVIAYFMSWLGTPRVVIIKDHAMAQENIRIFNFLWECSVAPEYTTSEILYETE